MVRSTPRSADHRFGVVSSEFRQDAGRDHVARARDRLERLATRFMHVPHALKQATGSPLPASAWSVLTGRRGAKISRPFG